jgi:hypothetical protein
MGCVRAGEGWRLAGGLGGYRGSARSDGGSEASGISSESARSTARLRTARDPPPAARPAIAAVDGRAGGEALAAAAAAGRRSGDAARGATAADGAVLGRRRAAVSPLAGAAACSSPVRLVRERKVRCWMLTQEAAVRSTPCSGMACVGKAAGAAARLAELARATRARRGAVERLVGKPEVCSSTVLSGRIMSVRTGLACGQRGASLVGMRCLVRADEMGTSTGLFSSCWRWRDSAE